MFPTDLHQALENWPKIIKKYKTPSTKAAVTQLLNTFLPFVGLWILMYFSLSWSYLITLGLAFVNGFLLARIFIIQHDCGHQSFLKSSKWNNRVGFFCSFFSSIPYKYWARIHSFHHGHTGQLEYRDIGDIDFLTVEEYRKRSRWGKFKYRLFRHPIVMFGLLPTAYFMIPNRIPTIFFNGWQKFHTSQIINNVCLAAVYVTLAICLGWQQFLMVHIPIIFFFSVISFWFFYVQHQHEKTYMQWQGNWDYLMAAVQGSTYYKLPKIFQWLSGNIGFHHIHHLSHLIPNYNLEKCAKENPILQKYVNIITFRDSLKTISNKLWDEQNQKMISFREFYQRGLGKK